jgi:hypothetical protein
MRNPIDIDHRHSQAICDEIGERQQSHLRVEPELPLGLRMSCASPGAAVGKGPMVQIFLPRINDPQCCATWIGQLRSGEPALFVLALGLGEIETGSQLAPIKTVRSKTAPCGVPRGRQPHREVYSQGWA